MEQLSQAVFPPALTSALACAAISPSLRSILMFDASPETLRLVAQTTTQMLEVVTGYPIVSVTLGTFEAEDDLWGSLGLGDESETEPAVTWKPGLLTGGQQDSPLRLIVIPDLTKLSLAATRACVVLIGADVAHLERHGQHKYWQPNCCWLVGCATSEVGMVSPHLLDRFALRLSGEVETNEDRVAAILDWIDQRELGKETKPEPLSKETCDRLKNALQSYPKIAPEAIARVLDYTTNLEVYSPRREIALARLALAYTRWKGAAEMTVRQVDTTASMMGLKPVERQQQTEEDLLEGSPEPVIPQSREPQTTEEEPQSTQPKPVTVTEKVYEPDEPEPQPTITFTVSNPYPEDQAPVEREASSLRLPSRRLRFKAATSGVIIGVEKVANFQDLALVRTLLEAAKYQPIRQRSTTNSHRLLLSPTDLHSYRRAPVAEQMLMLILDHTCLRDCDWQNKLLRYLSWAYVERASICLIQVGAVDAQHELRAQKLMAQSVLMPQINAGIEAGRGKATPLAHGLDLALQTLRYAMQHGRSTIQQVMLVVISDGRGNVSLEASRLGKILPPVGRKGIEDALQVAERIRGFDGVKAVLLNPQPKQYEDLPLELAQAMGAKVALIQPLETWEVK
ncbi:MAG: hypothetical protein F6K47_23315 [Symploca sp. SIO2E6]|nr:hypothetical protein [Symploca sp. SIO2E6]